MTALIESLEAVVASHVDMAESLWSVLQGDGDADAVQTVLEHGLEVLDALSMSSPRKQRKAVDGMCERVEAVLEDVESTLDQLSMQ